MSDNKDEKQLIDETIHNLELIIQFLNDSLLYKHQTLLIKNLQSMVDGKHKLSSKGFTVKKRTLESLKRAVANTPNLQTCDGKPCLQQEKVKLLDDCMKIVTTNIEHIPDDVIVYTSSYFTTSEQAGAALGSAFFKPMLDIKDLFTALVMGYEELAQKIVHAHPDLLFKKGTYKIPLLNHDGSISETSEQIYNNVTPLELMFYIGDWKMEECILPLIPKIRLEEALKEKKESALGGPDLVKIDCDPSTLSVQELRYFNLKNRNGQTIHFRDFQPITGDLLHNRNGIFCHELDSQHMEFYFVDIHPETQLKTVIKLSEPANMTPRDQDELNEFKTMISNNIAMNSSIRTSDYQHALIQRLFGITLERRGIHYTLNGVDYQDTYDGCVRLKNAYRRFFEIVYAQETWGPDCNAALINFIGMAQRFAMVHVMQIFCKWGQRFYPLPQKNVFKYIDSTRDNEFRYENNVQQLHPMYVNYGMGYNFVLTRSGREFCLAHNIPSDARVSVDALRDLLVIFLIDEVRKECSNEQVHALEQRLESLNNLKS